jgi:hypothetical protein
MTSVLALKLVTLETELTNRPRIVLGNHFAEMLTLLGSAGSARDQKKTQVAKVVKLSSFVASAPSKRDEGWIR